MSATQPTSVGDCEICADTIVAQIADERDQLAVLAAAIDWRWSARSVIESRVNALTHVLVLLGAEQ